MEKRHDQGENYMKETQLLQPESADDNNQEQQRTPRNPNTEGEGQNFAPPQKDDWPEEDESKQHPGGPTRQEK